MARFRDVGAVVDGNAIQVNFRLDPPGAVGWRIDDPSTGAILLEGAGARVELPEGEGLYRVQVAPVADRKRFILIDAKIGASSDGGRVEISPPRVVTAAALRWEYFPRAVPKAFIYP